MNYVLITPAHNEAAFIERTLGSMCHQTVLPERWVIVDDGSTDRTAQIVEDYASRYSWIELVRRPQRQDRNFAAKVQAVNVGLERVRSLPFEIVGNLDADVSFEADYMAFLMQQFSKDPELGVGGTPFTQDGGYDSTKDSFEGDDLRGWPVSALPIPVFSRHWRLCAQSGGRSRLDCSNDSADEGLEGSVVSGKAVSSSSAFRHGAAQHYGRMVFSRRNGLLFGWLTGLAALSRRLSDDKATSGCSRPGFVGRLLLGGSASN
jgi:hypothetical protein